MTQRLPVGANVAFLFVTLSLLGCSSLSGPSEPCQEDKGCGREPAPIPECSADVASVEAVEAIGALESRIDQRVVLAGTLRGDWVCTLIGCPNSNPCCNNCYGSMVIELAASEFEDPRVELRDSTETDRFAMWGDESLACSPYAMDVEVRAVGTVVRDGESGSFALLDPVLCLP